MVFLNDDSYINNIVHELTIIVLMSLADPPTVVIAVCTLALSLVRPAKTPWVVDWIMLGDTAGAYTVTAMCSIEG